MDAKVGRLMDYIYIPDPKLFSVKEFVDPGTYATLGEEDSWWVLDPRIVWTAEGIRKYLGKPMIINTWSNGGQFSQRGFRPTNSGTGAPNSQHRYGRALDYDIVGMSPEEVRTWIKTNLSKLDCLKYITTLEQGISWVHMDVRAYDRPHKGLLLVTP